MDDAMIDLVAGDAEVGRRLMAFAEARLTPELGATSRMRAKVLATAHRQADLARADARLAVLSRPAGVAAVEDGVTPARLRAGARARRRRVAAVILAAALGLSATAGTAFAAQAGGALYRIRVQFETLILPVGGQDRAAAEVRRLQSRLEEASAATSAGDLVAAQAALAAYDDILAEATTNDTIISDADAAATLSTGVRHNLVVLHTLAGRLPDAAQDGIHRALDNAIERATRATQPPPETVGNGAPDTNDGAGRNGNGGNGTGGDPNGGNTNGGNPGAGNGGNPGAGNGGNGNGGGTNHTPGPTPTSAPPDPTPAATPAETPAPTPAATPKPHPTPRPHPTKTPKPARPPVEHKTPVPGPKSTHAPRSGG